MRLDELDCRLVRFPILRITVFFFNLRGKFFERTVEATTTDVDSPFGLGHICNSLSGTDPARGTICSIVAVSSVSVAPQYMQFHPSRFAIELTSNLRLEALRGFRSLFSASVPVAFFPKAPENLESPIPVFRDFPVSVLEDDRHAVLGGKPQELHRDSLGQALPNREPESHDVN